MAMTSQISDRMSSSIFRCCFVSLVKFSGWSRFHVNINTGSGVMKLSFFKGLTRNPEVRNNPDIVLLNIWRLERANNTKFGTDVSNKMLLDTAKCQGYKFYSFWVSNGTPTGGQIYLPTIQIRVKQIKMFFYNFIGFIINHNFYVTNIECIASSSSLSAEKIKLLIIVSRISHVLDYFRLFMKSFTLWTNF